MSKASATTEANEAKCLLPIGNKSIALHSWCQYFYLNYPCNFILIFMQMRNMSKCPHMAL